MADEVSFRVLFLIGLIAFEALQMPHRQRREGINDSISPTQMVVDVGIFVLIELLPAIFVFFGWPDFADYVPPPGIGTAALIAGAIVLAAGLWVLWRAHADLGSNWSPTVRILKEQQLITNGLYATVRHPIYAAILLLGLAQLLLLHNCIVGPSGLLGFLLIYFGRVPAEERIMLDHFGDEYRAYMQRTGRIIPRLGR